MPTFKYQESENLEFVLLPIAHYPFEIIGVEFGISTGAKTAGAENMWLEVKFFKDVSFETPLAQWSEQIIFHPSCQRFVDTFVQCCGIKAAKDEEIDFTEELLLGLRGICHVSQKTNPKSREPDKLWNYVQTWFTNKEKLPRNPDAETGEEEDVAF